jgi:hypothetical protein
MNQLEPTNVAIAMASVLFGPALAGVIGPYAVILIASTVGAAWALGRRDPLARLGAAGYFLRLNATALLITVGLSTLAGNWLGFAETNWMLAPIALFVGGVGDDWPKIGRWVIERLGRILERRTGDMGGGDGGAA